MLDERALDRVQLAVAREPLDRRDLAALGLLREHRAALHRASVEEHGARAALARVAADVRPGEPEPVAERVDEERPRLDLERARLAVDDDETVSDTGGQRGELLAQVREVRLRVDRRRAR